MISEYFSTIYYVLCNSFNTPPCLVLAKATCHLRQCKHLKQVYWWLIRVLEIQPQMILEFNELDLPQVLGEHVGRIHLSRHKHEFNLLGIYNFADIMIPDVYVLSTALLHRVTGNEDGALVVTVYRNCFELYP